jgi:hypothetical protein
VLTLAFDERLYRPTRYRVVVLTSLTKYVITFERGVG